MNNCPRPGQHDDGPDGRPDACEFRSSQETRNAKIMRRVIRAKHLGLADLGDLSGLDNPAAIEEIGRAR